MSEAVTACQIARALRHARHREDLFVEECKTGPSQGMRHRVMDAWAMRRSYSRPLICAYEIKVTRRDFQQDTKWQEYLPYCNQFFWATPWKLVLPEEVSGEAGLIWVTNTGTRCVVKKKAAQRELKLSLDPPYGVFNYLLFSRARIGPENGDGLEGRLSEWRYWLDLKHDADEVGRRVGGKVRETVQREIDRVRKRNEELERENHRLAEIRKFVVEELGVPEKELSAWYSDRAGQSVKKRLRAARKFVPEDMERRLQGVSRDLDGAARNLRKAVGDFDRIINNEE